MVIVLVVCGRFNLGYWHRLDRREGNIDGKTQQAEQKNRELADVKVHYSSGNVRPTATSGGST